VWSVWRRLPAFVAIVIFLAIVLAQSTQPPATAAVHPSVSAPEASSSCPWIGSTAPIPQRVAQVMEKMTEAQELQLVDGIGAGGEYVFNLPAIPALCIPALNMEDGPQGVGDYLTGVTQLPAGVAAASTWDTGLEKQYGSVVGAEEVGKGVNVDLGPTVNIVRDPRWGRAFESFGEDPYLNGQMAGAYIKGVRSKRVIAQVKHYAIYNNETNRNTPADDDVVTERTEQEIYLPAFQSAVDAGAGSVMCAYSEPNGVPACENSYLLGVLDSQMGFGGFVGSDWGATPSNTAAAIEAGEDIDMPGDSYFGSQLQADIPSQVPRAYLDDAVERILTELFRAGLMGSTATGSLGTRVTSPAHVTTATKVAEEGTVLLKDADGLLPLNSSSVGSIAVIGGNADTRSDQCGTGSSGNLDAAYPYSGGGSACVEGSGKEITPLAGIKAAAPKVGVTYNSGSQLSSAVSAAKRAKVAIVFAGYRESECSLTNYDFCSDLTTIDLGPAEDRLIRAVAAAQRNTIVVLNTGSAVTMPWLGNVHAVLEQWYPGQVDGTALAALLFGSVDPSGHLPVTFPTSLSEVPASTPEQFPGAGNVVDYSEGIDVGYRWYQSKDLTPLFPFGFGLSYTKFAFSDLSISGFDSSKVATVTATVTNVGSVAGSDVAQLYVGDPAATGEPPWQLKGFRRVNLAAGATTSVTFNVPVHDLTRWGGPGAGGYPTAASAVDADGWEARSGSYSIGVGDSSANLPLRASINLAAAVGPDTVKVPTPKSETSAIGSPVLVAVKAVDSAPGQRLRYAASGLPGGLSIDPSTGTITGKPLNAGTNTVTVTATDGNAFEGSASFSWTIVT
jgi:beta-glucosidase